MTTMMRVFSFFDSFLSSSSSRGGLRHDMSRAPGMFSFYLLHLFILTTFKFYNHQTLPLPNQTLKANEDQRRPTQAHDSQRRPHHSQQRPTRANPGSRPTTANKSYNSLAGRCSTSILDSPYFHTHQSHHHPLWPPFPSPTTHSQTPPCVPKSHPFNTMSIH
jgi:hypothetical protein